MFDYTVMSSVGSRPRVRGQGWMPAKAQGTDAHSRVAGVEQGAGVRPFSFAFQKTEGPGRTDVRWHW